MGRDDTSWNVLILTHLLAQTEVFATSTSKESLLGACKKPFGLRSQSYQKQNILGPDKNGSVRWAIELYGEQLNEPILKCCLSKNAEIELNFLGTIHHSDITDTVYVTMTVTTNILQPILFSFYHALSSTYQSARQIGIW